MKQNFIKSLIICIAICCATVKTSAVPANPRPFTVTQKDGSKLELRFIGDENFHYYATTDGVPLVKEGENYFYAEMDNGSRLLSSGILAHNRQERKSNELTFIEKNNSEIQSRISSLWKERLDERNEQLISKVSARKAQNKAFGHPTKYEGNKKGIVILVNYADLKMKTTSSAAAWNDQFNKPGYNKNNHYGSVRDYFLDQSYQKLSIDFDVVGPYTVSKPWRYYGKNRGSATSDSYPCQLVTEACRLANADVNFKDYDWNGDGEVDQVFVIYAGYSAAAGYDEDAIWPHEWHLAYGAYYGDGNGSLMLDGVKIDNYAVSSELSGTSGSTMDYIGTAVHEFSHCLGLPDFYDVDGNGTQCMDYWDVLDAGCYSGPNWKGEVPTGYTAYERHFAGWLDYEELNQPKKVTGLQNLGDVPEAYIYYNKGNRNEYFILENRQAKAWFKYPVSAHGLFIYHVDFDQAAWENGRPNSDPNHPRMTYIPADKSFDRAYTNQMTSDFFPGTGAVKTITNTSHTSCYGKMFNKNSDGTYNTNMELTAITETGGKISFTFNGGETGQKTKLRSLITEVSALLEVPHIDLSDNATQLLQEAIEDAEYDRQNAATTEELQAAMEALKRKAVEFIANANPTDSIQPFDISFLLVNPEITSNEGWKDEAANNAYVYANNCGEYKDIKFTLSQTISIKLPKGQYTLACQAFQRTGTLAESQNNAVNTYLFARTKSAKIKNILDGASETKKGTTDTRLDDGLYVPGDNKSANNYFKAGMYTNTLDFENTSETGTQVKLGLRSASAKTNYWTCFSKFKLYAKGIEIPDAIKSVTEDIKDASIYDLTGRRITNSENTKGIFIKQGRKLIR